jgi:hypothetical protein
MFGLDDKRKIVAGELWFCLNHIWMGIALAPVFGLRPAIAFALGLVVFHVFCSLIQASGRLRAYWAIPLCSWLGACLMDGFGTLEILPLQGIQREIFVFGMGVLVWLIAAVIWVTVGVTLEFTVGPRIRRWRDQNTVRFETCEEEEEHNNE